MDNQHLVLGIGELLWDVLPDGARLGGAPANFAVMADRLGDRAAILSRVGCDALGSEALERLEPSPAETNLIQVDAEHETGRVTVEFKDGEPHYTIHSPAAWDFLLVLDEWVQMAERADAICFGTLAQRSAESRQAIQTLAASCRDECVRIFDVNLRAPYYSAEVIVESMRLATVVKMNADEAAVLMAMLGLGTDGDSSEFEKHELTEALTQRKIAERLLAEFPALELVAVTKGARGSLLMTRSAWHEHPGFAITVADAVGAGDAFTAALAHYLLRGAGLATLNDAGNRWGSWVASQAGAMPELPEAERKRIAAQIERVS
jgi:fructokinase